MDPVLIIILVVVCLPLLYVILTYNTLVALRNHIKESWSDIDTELKRRYDLIPNLVNTVKAYAKHEESLFKDITELRNQCRNNQGSVSSQQFDETQLVNRLQKLMILVEDYPDLKSSENFLQLQKELVNTEDRIQSSRRFYNGNIRDYRNKTQSFPSNIIANMFKFKAVEFFNVDASIREVPSAKFED